MLAVVACSGSGQSPESEQSASASHVEPRDASISEECSATPEPWRCLLGKSTAAVETFDVKPAYELGGKALQACAAAGETHCPAWEATRMELYLQHLKAGIDSGIDPRRDPVGFQRAGDAGSRTIRLKRDRASGSDAGSSGSAHK